MSFYSVLIIAPLAKMRFEEIIPLHVFQFTKVFERGGAGGASEAKVFGIRTNNHNFSA
jgi:hypothetical protein